MLITTSSFAGDFIPPEENEPPVLAGEVTAEELMPFCLVSIGTAISGIAVTAIGIYSIFSNIEAGFDSPVMQGAIITTIGGGILTAAASVLFDFIINGTDSSD